MEDNSVTVFGGMGIGSPEDASPVMYDGSARGSKSTARTSSTCSTMAAPPSFPPPKTDKPRPHVCTTCMRSFARLEHLKRHERSHTKEKPFECPECTRCFARRDLLLRHQQKLHSTTTPSSRPRAGRRESAAGVAAGRIRKNSMANGTTSTMRPRANTVSHVDSGTLGMLANPHTGYARPFVPGHAHHNSMGAIPGAHAMGYRGMSNAHNSVMALPKLETSGLPIDLSSGLRTAPPYGGFGAEFGMSTASFFHGHGNTINPHALHMHGLQGLGIEHTGSPFQQIFPGMPHAMTEDDGSFDWVAHGFENQMLLAQTNDTAIDDSSPSAMSTSSPANTNDIVSEIHPMSMQHANIIAGQWHQPTSGQTQMVNSPLSMDFNTHFNDIIPAPAGTVSPKSLLAQGGQIFEMSLPTPPDMNTIDVSIAAGMHYTSFQLPLSRDGGASTTSSASHDSSLRQSSVTTMSSDLVSDHIRNNLIAGLSQHNPFNHRKYSQPAISSPLSPDNGPRNKVFGMTGFPSTQDLQRYVQSYIRYFHPHLPFLHIATLNFESAEYIMPIRGVGGQLHFNHNNVTGGGSCLILSIAAIGALYEHDSHHSRDLFDCAKRLVGNVLEERRKTNMSKAQFAPRQSNDSEDTPLWLVQAMLLNVIYGHNCGDKTAAELASNHCAALVSLARSAELARPYTGFSGNRHGSFSQQNLHGQNGSINLNGWTSMINENDDVDWLDWKVMEERKRTLYAVFTLSSMLVTAYNHAPALTNSEIRLELPCDEELWAAESAQTWQNLGGVSIAESKSTTFAAALTHLLMSAQREQRQHNGSTPVKPNDNELRPSTFGCLILINALHNYIWETRQRHLGKQWTAKETEQMYSHIEPALRAWQAAWASNPTHSLERPNPFGAGPLSADSIPLLDLAYVRLFINLGRSRGAFWQRNYDTMAEEFAKTPDMSKPLENADVVGGDKTTPDTMANSADNVLGLDVQRSPASKRERQLRRAAFYAADSLSMSDKLGPSFTESTSRELPIQSALCAFDCAQVLAEWVTTVQERVGRYLGVMGKDDIDTMQVPGFLLLEDEDQNLLDRISEVLVNAEQKAGGNMHFNETYDGGYGYRILMLTAQSLERSAVWPVTKLMAQSLETQAVHLKERALASVAATQNDLQL